MYCDVEWYVGGCWDFYLVVFVGLFVGGVIVIL